MRTLHFFLLVLVVLVMPSCNSRTKEIEAFQSNFKKVVDPRTLQVWAVEVTKTNEIGNQLPISELPSFLQLTNSPSSVDISAFAGVRGKVLFLNWGSGFGHWGLIVGDTDFVVKDISTLKLSLWRPGIYFYVDTK